MRALLTAALLLVIGLSVFSVACADEQYSAEVTAVKSTAVPNTWIYTVRNTSSSSQYALWLFGIEVDQQTDAVNAITPGGWSADTESQEHLVQWVYLTGSLAVGAQKGGFQATFSGSPSFQRFTAQFDNAVTGEVPEAHGVVSTPEPAGIAVLLTGLAPFVGFALRRRSRG